MSSSTVSTYTPVQACAQSDVDPEWWVHEHPGVCGKDCSHGLAAHICLNHCPFLTACQDYMAVNEEDFQGMVVGGLMRVRHAKGNLTTTVPKTLKLTCELCKQRASLVF